ncbi:SMAD/FHA domain-containing protein, partial [Fennellomyces sp. T-0311]
NTAPSVSDNSHDDDLHIRLVPHVTYTSQCYVFDVIERTLQHGGVLKFGRYNNDRQPNSNRLSFRSKVVSRSHAELWVDDGKVYIRDTGSSSGTFVNRMRLPYGRNSSDSIRELFDGDIVQLGVDYQNGSESIYRAVRMRIQISHPCHEEDKKASSFSKTAFQQLCCRTTPNKHPKGREDVQECSICLYAIAPSQALFVAPCSHVYHYKCLRPLLEQNFPAFSCPLCRTYSDLNASVEVDVDEVME